jgi:hypothetical protein
LSLSCTFLASVVFIKRESGNMRKDPPPSTLEYTRREVWAK